MSIVTGRVYIRAHRGPFSYPTHTNDAEKQHTELKFVASIPRATLDSQNKSMTLGSRTKVSEIYIMCSDSCGEKVAML